MYNGATAEDIRWIAKQRREFVSYEEARDPQSFVSYSSLADIPYATDSPITPAAKPGPNNSTPNMQAMGSLASGAGSYWSGVGSAIGSVGGVINQGIKIKNDSDQFQQKLDFDKMRLAQQDRQFNIGSDRQNAQFNASLAFKQDQMDRAWSAAKANGLASPFAMQAPARINPTGSNDGFVNLGNYSIQTALNW